jgi:hypothetical protein
VLHDPVQVIHERLLGQRDHEVHVVPIVVGVPRQHIVHDRAGVVEEGGEPALQERHRLQIVLELVSEV